MAAAFQAHPEARWQLNIFITGGSRGGASGFALMPEADRNFDQAIVLLGAKTSDGSGNRLNYAASGTITHELGHVFGLLHTYAEGGGAEIGDPQSYDYLNDICMEPNVCHGSKTFPQ